MIKKRRLTIVTLGDSLSKGYCSKQCPNKPFTQKFSELLRYQFSGVEKISLLDLSQSGSFSHDVKNQLINREKTSDQSNFINNGGHQFNIFFIWTGMNDLTLYAKQASCISSTISNIESTYQYITNCSEWSDGFVVILGIPKSIYDENIKEFKDMQWYRTNRKVLNMRLKDLASKYMNSQKKLLFFDTEKQLETFIQNDHHHHHHTPFIQQSSGEHNERCDPIKKLKEFYISDWKDLHFNEKGYDLIGELMFENLKEELQMKLCNS